MGKRIISRARGAGGPRYVSPSHRYLGEVSYLPSGNFSGKVVDIVHDPGRSAPVAIIQTNDGKQIFQIAAQGLQVGSTIQYGGEVLTGNVVELSKLTEGMKIFAVENYPGSGPKFCRSSGTFATVLGRSGNKVSVQFPSGKTVIMDERCRATVGIPAGSGRVEKPWTKAGKHWYARHRRAKIFPRTAGVAMTPADHPFGGKSHRPHFSKVVSRHAPPGQKVGSVAARRVGKRKGS